MSTIQPLNTATLAAQAAQEHASNAANKLSNIFKEAHPFARKSVILQPHPVAWNFYARKLGRAAIVYVPGITFVLGWPMLAKWVINWKNGVYDTPKKGVKVGRR